MAETLSIGLKDSNLPNFSINLESISNIPSETMNIPVNISINLGSIPTAPSIEPIYFSRLLKFVLGIIIFICVTTLIIFLSVYFTIKSDSNSTNPIEIILSTIDNINTNTETTTTSQTTVTTTVTCANGYSQSPSGGCFNLQIDFNNCGSFGYVCSLNYTSCSAGSCSGAPAVQLPGAISVIGWGGQFSIDDAYLTLNLPVNLTLYNISSSNVSVTSNGVVCLGACSSAYSNGNLPDGNFGGPTAFGFYDDLMIYGGTSQTVYYNVNGISSNKTTTFEFYESHYGSSTQYYHFQIIFYENIPNIVYYKYFQISDGGQSATVGVQQSSSGPAIVYSVDQSNSVPNNLTLIFDTIGGTYIIG